MRAIRDRLRELYGRPVNEPHGEPIAELVRTVLSQNTNDRNRDVAYGRLRERFPTWEEVRDAPLEEVEEAIRPGGLAPTEGAADPGDPAPSSASTADLDWLRGAPREEAIGYLTALPGRRPQDGGLRADLHLGRPEIPVDTHVYRVGGRLGLFRPRASFERGARRDAARSPIPRTPTSSTST